MCGNPELAHACIRLARLNRALEVVHGLDDPSERGLRKSRDNAKATVERLLDADDTDKLAQMRRHVAEQEAGGSRPDPETLAFRDTAIVIGIATAAAIGVAPLAAWAVHEAVVKGTDQDRSQRHLRRCGDCRR